MGRDARTNKSKGETGDEIGGRTDDKNSSEARENSRAERRNVSVNEMEEPIKDFFQTYFSHLNGPRVTFATGERFICTFWVFWEAGICNPGVCMIWTSRGE